MNKKIISIFFLLLIFISITMAYSYYTSNNNEQSYNSPIQTISENNITEEIDETFIEEDDEIEIGEMV
jgi:CHASE3 domain sensor protein